jgi:hypothetical protein
MSELLKILPVKKVNTQKTFNVNPVLLEPPFTQLLLAPTKSGKSVLICNLLLNINFYKDVYDEIYFISPTVFIDPTLNAIAEDDEIIKIHEEEDLDKIDVILKDIIDEQKKAKMKDKDAPHILIVLDDMISYFKNNTLLDKAPSFSRHFNVSFIISTQSYVGTPTKLRRNTASYIIFKLYNNADLKQFYDEIGSQFKDFMEYYNEATEDKYNFIYCNQRDMKIYHNFTKLLWEK